MRPHIKSEVQQGQIYLEFYARIKWLEVTEPSFAMNGFIKSPNHRPKPLLKYILVLSRPSGGGRENILRGTNLGQAWG